MRCVNLMRRYQILSMGLLGLLFGFTGFILPRGTLENSDVPSEFQELYSTLKASLDSYEAYLNSISTGENYPVIFGAELLPANSNRGEDLLAPQTLQATILFLDRLRELGVQGVTIPVHYPLYTPDFPRYQEYVQFFKQVVQEIENRGMKLDVEAHVIFANTPFSPLDISYAGLTFDRYKIEKKQMLATIIQDLRPDYLNIVAEPDTEYALIGLEELKSPEKYTEFINYLLADLDRSGTKIGAGIGTWGNLDYVKSFAAKTSLDFIVMHVYPVTGKFLQNIVAIADIAKQYNKRVILDEAWLYKIDTFAAEHVAASVEVFRRDAFSFWAPLDQQFLSIIVKSARLKNIEYISPFWTTFFFGYVDYSPSTARLSYSEIAAMVNRIAAMNILADKFTSTGEFYRKLTGANASAVSTQTSQTGSAPTTHATTITDFTATTGGGTPSLPVVPIIAVIAIGIVVLSVLLRRRNVRTRKAS